MNKHEKILVQALWDEFSAIIRSIGNIVDDYPIDKQPYDKLNSLIIDDPKMAAIRKELHKIGIKRIWDEIFYEQHRQNP